MREPLFGKKIRQTVDTLRAEEVRRLVSERKDETRKKRAVSEMLGRAVSVLKSARSLLVKGQQTGVSKQVVGRIDAILSNKYRPRG